MYAKRFLEYRPEQRSPPERPFSAFPGGAISFIDSTEKPSAALDISHVEDEPQAAETPSLGGWVNRAAPANPTRLFL